MPRKSAPRRPASPAPQTAAASALIDVGQPAPTFRLPDQTGAMHDLAEDRGQWVVLYFYPKDDTSGCTREACQFRDAFGQFQRRGVILLGVSPDDPARHLKFAAKHQLPFTLLADEGVKVCSAYGVWQQKSMYGRKYMGVVRTTYLIAPDGKVAHRWDKVAVPGHDAQVLSQVDALRGK